MSRYKIKISTSYYKGVIFGIGFPMNDYVGVTLCIGCFAIHINWKSR